MRNKGTGELCMLIMVCLFASCASSYKSLHPQVVNYTNETVSDSIKFSYKYDILWDARNMRYAKKEKKLNTKIAAVKLVNNSNKTLDFRDVMLFAGDKLIASIPNDSLYDQFKQPVGPYILYLLLTPIHKFSVNVNGPSHIFPFGFIVGPVLAGWNIMVAAGANSDFKYDMEKYNIRDQKIPSGETVYGIIGIGVDDYLPLSIKIKRHQ